MFLQKKCNITCLQIHNLALHVPSLCANSLWAGVRERNLSHLHSLELVDYALPQSDFIQSVTLTKASQKDYCKNFNIHLKYCLSALVIVFTSHSQSSSARPICETFFLSIHWSKRFWTLDPTPTILYRPWSVIPGILNKNAQNNMRTDCCYTKGFVTILFLKVSNLHVISNSRYLHTKTSKRILNKLTSFFHCWNALWDKTKFKIFSFLWKKHKNGNFYCLRKINFTIIMQRQW